MKFGEPRNRRHTKTVDALGRVEAEEPGVETLIPPEIWQKILDYIPETLHFELKGYQQKYEGSTYLLLAFPELRKKIELGPEVEKKLRKQLDQYKKDKQETLWLGLLLCARIFFSEKKQTYSVEALWPELLQDKDLQKSSRESYWLRVGLLFNHPSVREELIDSDFVETGKMIADKNSESYTQDREYPLIIFSPEYKEQFSKNSIESTKKLITRLVRKAAGGEVYYLSLLMEQITLLKMMTAKSIEFEGDTIYFRENTPGMGKKAGLPERQLV